MFLNHDVFPVIFCILFQAFNAHPFYYPELSSQFNYYLATLQAIVDFILVFLEVSFAHLLLSRIMTRQGLFPLAFDAQPPSTSSLHSRFASIALTFTFYRLEIYLSSLHASIVWFVIVTFLSKLMSPLNH